MDGVLLIRIFLSVVDELMSQPRLYALSNRERYINFRADDFKRKLKEVMLRNHSCLSSSKIKPILDDFKVLQWIICDKERFTNVQKINEKSARVLTVDRSKYELLKSLDWEDS
ncbi:hypothetical protein AALA24_05365 [Anaerovoracaceae bacterium 42-11]